MNNFDPTRQIAIIWSCDDVQGLAMENYDVDLSDEQAMKVLQYVKNHMDCNEGVNWNTLDYALNEIYPEIENGKV